VLGLQLARAAGLRTIITSSSDEKLQRARELGAHHTVNYRTFPEWQEEVLRLTHGAGAHVVLEVGGQGTVNRSVASTAMGGSVAIIGGVSGFGGEAGLQPVVDRVFTFDQAREAYRHMESGSHFGKVVIAVA
jgi:NADPH:quinone reductase-like Zn-dependent oxidoreductase